MGIGHLSISARLLDSLREKNGGISQDDEDFTAKVTSIIYFGECYNDDDSIIIEMYVALIVLACRWSRYSKLISKGFEHSYIHAPKDCVRSIDIYSGNGSQSRSTKKSPRRNR